MGLYQSKFLLPEILCFYLSSSPKTARIWRETRAGLLAISGETPHFLGNLSGWLPSLSPEFLRSGRTRVLRVYFKSFLGLGEAGNTTGTTLLLHCFTPPLAFTTHHTLQTHTQTQIHTACESRFYSNVRPKWLWHLQLIKKNLRQGCKKAA